MKRTPRRQRDAGRAARTKRRGRNKERTKNRDGASPARAAANPSPRPRKSMNPSFSFHSAVRRAARTFLLITLLAVARPSAAVETGFLNKTAEAGDQSMPYVVYVPRVYSAQKRWPVILFLHGSGERG